MPIVVLDVQVTFIGETVLPEAEHWHDPVIESFRPRKVGHGDVNVVNADDFEAHRSLVCLTRPNPHTFGGLGIALVSLVMSFREGAGDS